MRQLLALERGICFTLNDSKVPLLVAGDYQIAEGQIRDGEPAVTVEGKRLDVIAGGSAALMVDEEEKIMGLWRRMRRYTETLVTRGQTYFFSDQITLKGIYIGGEIIWLHAKDSFEGFTLPLHFLSRTGLCPYDYFETEGGMEVDSIWVSILWVGESGEAKLYYKGENDEPRDVAIWNHPNWGGDGRVYAGEPEGEVKFMVEGEEAVKNNPTTKKPRKRGRVSRPTAVEELQ